VQLELRGVPTVTIVSDVFETLARGESAGLGMARLPLLVVGHPVGSRSALALEVEGRGLAPAAITALVGGRAM
jgi:hypothetical protein